MNRTFEGMEAAISAHNEFNGVAAEYTPEQLTSRMEEIFSGLNSKQLDLNQGAPAPKLS